MASPIPPPSYDDVLRFSREIMSGRESRLVKKVVFLPSDDKIARMELSKTLKDEASRMGYVACPIYNSQGEISSYNIFECTVPTPPLPKKMQEQEEKFDASNASQAHYPAQLISPQPVHDLIPKEAARLHAGEVESENSQPGRPVNDELADEQPGAQSS